jgi:hypothetical protein
MSWFGFPLIRPFDKRIEFLGLGSFEVALKFLHLSFTRLSVSKLFDKLSLLDRFTNDTRAKVEDPCGFEGSDGDIIWVREEIQ